MAFYITVRDESGVEANMLVVTFTGVPQLVADGLTFTVSDNTQIVAANPVVTLAGGVMLTAGTGAAVCLS